MRIRFAGILSVVVLEAAISLWVQASDSTGKPTDAPLLHTAVTGRISATGLNDPQYLLSFPSVQRAMLRATEHCLKQSEIEKELMGTPVSLADLLRLGLLRESENTYCLNYLLLTVQDQEAIYKVGAHYGQSLAADFRVHKHEFDVILDHYPNANLRSQLLFDLVAGVSLNWRGLDLTTELGYRIEPPRHENGDIYIVHSNELGAKLDSAGLYLDSETAPGSKMSFSTFGDGNSLPRLLGLPDVFDGIETATDSWQNTPDVYGALRSEYVTYVLLALDDAGQIMDAVGNGNDTDAAIAKAVVISEERRKATLGLLTAIGYLRVTDNHNYVIAVPVLRESDKSMVDASVELSRTIMARWLKQNYPKMKQELATLSPMRNDVPFSLAFNEVWHYVFGFAAKSLAESGFYANPRAASSRYAGYVPLVWATSVLKAPGS